MSSSISVGGVAYAVLKWDNEILMASFYHNAKADSETAATDGTKWCSQWANPVKDATVALQAAHGFDKNSKCTW